VKEEEGKKLFFYASRGLKNWIFFSEKGKGGGGGEVFEREGLISSQDSNENLKRRIPWTNGGGERESNHNVV